MSKKNLILGAIFIALGLFAYFYQGPWKNWQTKIDKPINFFSNIKFDEIAKIEVTNNKQTIRINKEEDKWKFTDSKGFTVSQEISKNISEQVNNLINTEIELISNNKNNKKYYQTDENGIGVKLYNQDNLLKDFIIGKANQDSNYISETSSDKTYLFKTDIRNLFADTSSWYDKNIFTGKKEDINRIRFQYPNSELTVEKNNKKWEGILPYKFNINESKLTKILDIMSNLIAVKVPDQILQGTGLDKHLIIIQASGVGINNTLMIGETDKDGNYFAKKSDSDNLYVITKEQRNEFVKKISDLK